MIYSRSSINILLFNIVSLWHWFERKKLTRASVWSFHFSPCLCRFSSGTWVSSHIPKMCRWPELGCPNCPGLIECGWDGEWPFNGRYLFRVGPTLHLEPIMSRNWNKQVGKWLFYLFLLIFLKCMWSSHVSQCLILEVFGVFLWKFDISVTRNMPSEHNSCLCQLTCSKTGFVICGFA